MNRHPHLPIDAVLGDICGQLASAGALVLQAEPGAGKTTRVPQALLEAGVAGGQSILVLEPRRVAARAAADFVAGARGERIGDSVGFQVRFERCGGTGTRLWFVTEGIALRRLVADPFLDGVGALVFDEFHERHLAGDVLFAVADELRRTVRPDLKLLVMSATLDVDRIAAHLGGCPIVRCPGRVHPVAVEYRAASRDRRLGDEVVAAVRDVMRQDDAGDILVFLPGRGEIRRVGDDLVAAGIDRELTMLPLHGDLSLDAQRRVLRRSGPRRIVLATNVAESSVTVEGVAAVIDSGLARVPESDPTRGVERLRTVSISKASADQRAGRAGRERSGRCIRLWSKHDQTARRDRELPEIRRLELSSTVLELRAWGLRDLESLRWLDPPPPGALAAAEQLLRHLGALTPDGGVTAVGEQMLRLPAPPRAARLLIEANRLGQAESGALLAAILSEREITGTAPAPAGGASDLLRRAELFDAARGAGFAAPTCRSLGVDAAAARAVQRAADQLLRSLPGVRPAAIERDDGALLRATFVAFADRLARRRGAGDARAVMAYGGGVRLDAESCVRDAEYFVAVEVRAGDRRQHEEGRVTLASAVDRGWIAEYFPAEIERQRRVDFDGDGERAIAVDRELFRGLVLSERRSPTTGGAGSERLCEWALRDPERALNLKPRDGMMLRRIDFAERHGCPVVEGGAAELLRRAVAAACAGADSAAQLRRVDTAALFAGLLTFEQRRRLDHAAPESYALPSGRIAPIAYDRAGAPAVSARIQELFGLRDGPRVAGGAVAVAIEVLGPNHRPVQVTADLANFWAATYPEIRKQLRGRYPKHDWPEDPWNGVPTSRVGRRRHA